jgi:hypothetical protein
MSFKANTIDALAIPWAGNTSFLNTGLPLSYFIIS